MGLRVSSSRTAIKGKGQSTARLSPLCTHNKLSLQTGDELQSPAPWGFTGLCTQLPSTAGLEGPRPIIPCVFTPWKCFSKLIHLHYHVWASQNSVRGNHYCPPPTLLPHLTGEKTTSRNLRSAATERRGKHGSHLPPCRAWPWLQPARHTGPVPRQGPLSSARTRGPSTSIDRSVVANPAAHEVDHPSVRALPPLRAGGQPRPRRWASLARRTKRGVFQLS